jgi:hypothetical protein
MVIINGIWMIFVLTSLIQPSLNQVQFVIQDPTILINVLIVHTEVYIPGLMIGVVRKLKSVRPHQQVPQKCNDQVIGTNVNNVNYCFCEKQ